MQLTPNSQNTIGGQPPPIQGQTSPQAQPGSSSSVVGERSIGTILLGKGEITQDQLKQAQLEAANTRRTIESVIESKGWVNDINLTTAKSEFYNVPMVDISSIDISSEILNKISYDNAKTNKAVVFKQDEQGFHVAMADPLDVQKSRYLGLLLAGKVNTYYGIESEIMNYIETKYGARIGAQVEEALAEVGTDVVDIKSGIRDLSNLEGELQRAPVPRIVSMVLEYAATFKASDVHIEPRETKVGIRYRINGILTERQSLPKALGASVVTRIKIMSDLKIDEHRIPQDGRFQIKVKDKQIDLRVSVMPTVYGEKVVIRLLEKGGKTITLEDTGLRGSALKQYKKEIKSTEGIILISGPTGSGKTQTLASTLSLLNNQSVNIVTLEDPVEIRIDGVNQVQVNDEVGLTFAKGLRSFLRQDPDIIMVGEIRDSETAGLAVQAALVGRLVLSTLHTNSAAGALPRLLDMEIEPFLLSSTINLVAAQRLVRKVCQDCIEKYEAPQEVVKDFHQVLDGLKGFDLYSYPKRDHPNVPPGQVPNQQNAQAQIQAAQPQNSQQNASNPPLYLYRGKGCAKCNNTGYVGRIGIFEVLPNSEKVSKMIMEHRSAASIEKQAIEDGMITMRQDGYLKALEGITSIEEVLRVQNT